MTPEITDEGWCYLGVLYTAKGYELRRRAIKAPCEINPQHDPVAHLTKRLLEDVKFFEQSGF